MAMTCKHSGTLRTDYETDRARLDDFSALESDWQILLRWLGKVSRGIGYCDGNREGTLGKLFENQVLTVLVEIVQKDVLAYEDFFTDAQGTSGQVAYTENLHKKVRGWIVRLENFIGGSWKAGNGESTATQAARLIKEQLEKSMQVEKETDKLAYYQMLRTVGYIQEHTPYYLDLIENSGDMDGALALLLVYVKNYCRTTQDFNRQFASLPELYRKQVLHVRLNDAVQGNVYAVVTPTDGAHGFTLPKGHPFPAGQNAAGEDLIYHTTRAEHISPMRIGKVNAVFLKRTEGNVTGIYKQSIDPVENLASETPFADGNSSNLALGWMVESSMLLLREGERKVSIGFRVTTRSATKLPYGDLPHHSFSILISGAMGWAAQKKSRCRIDASEGCQWLRFEFIMDREGTVPTPCSAEIHGAVTQHPAIRIQTTNRSCPYDWASMAYFDTIKIRTEVSGIQNFIFYNELGEIDTTQPFYPFGSQADKGAWFMFGNEEIGHKPLEEVRLKGLWKKLPETAEDFNKLYKDYITGTTIDASSFSLATEWQENNRWNPCLNGKQHLFIPDKGENRSLKYAELIFDFPKQKTLNIDKDTPEAYEYDRERNGFFRATLQEPAIGFGTEAYRALFTETMIHNSRLKEKKQKTLPSTPFVPMLADAELSYIASEQTSLTSIDNSSITLTRITSLSENDTFPIEKEAEQPFITPIPTDNIIYFSFLRTQEERTLRMYLDMVLPKEKIPFYNPQPDKSIKIVWEYWKENSWKPLPITNMIAEETYGLTQSGFIEIKWPEKITASHHDKQYQVWLRAALTGDTSSCLAIRGIWTNCIRLISTNGDGLPLPAGTLQGTKQRDERIESVVQPMNGFGGKPAETETEVAVRQSARIHNRHRAIMIKDYEQLVLEHFPEVDKVQCLTIPQKQGASKVYLVVFSRAEDNRYYLSTAWKLAEILRFILPYGSPFIPLRVVNPVYEQVNIRCIAVLWDNVQDEGKALRQLTALAQNYIAPWYRKGEIPELWQNFSYKELHARMVNHEDMMKLVILEVNDHSLPRVNINTEDFIIKSKHPWHVLFPKITIELLSPHDGIDDATIEGNFIIR